MGFDMHGHSDHEHNLYRSKCSCSKTMRLSTMLILTFSFFFVELIVGEISNSISLVADSFHMLSDVIALGIGLFSVRISKRKSSDQNTFGWVRAEVLGALINSVFLISLCVSISIEAIKRCIESSELKKVNLMLYVSCAGLVMNLAGLVIFGHGHSHSVPTENIEELQEFKDRSDEYLSISNGNGDNDSLSENVKNSHENKATQPKESLLEKITNKESSKNASFSAKHDNLNIRAVFLHVLADTLGSVIVIISALLNKFQNHLKINDSIIRFVDPFLCIMLVILILSSTIPLFKETAFILLQTVPKDIELDQLKEELKKVKGVLSVHELHIWKLSGNKIIASAHITCHSLQEYMKTAAKVKKVFHEKGIHSTTIQPEFIDPSQEPLINCMLECKTNCNENTCCGQTNSSGLRSRTNLQQSEFSQIKVPSETRNVV